MSRRFHVYGVGNAIMDLQLRVEEQDITALGLTKAGMQLVDPEAQSKLLAHFSGKPIHQASGGSAANTMIAMAQLGAKVAYGCRVGADEFGTFYLDEMKKLSVTVNTTPAAGHVTGTCVVMITPDAERTMNTHLGASSLLDASDVPEELVKDADWVYIEGYLFSSETGQRVTRQVVEYARKHGTKIALTFSDGFIVDFFREPLQFAVDHADLIFANLHEAQKFTGLTDQDEVFAAFRRAAPMAVMTLSEKGALVSFEGDVHQIAPTPTKAVDDTGAGDMFAGGFLYALSQGMTVAEAGSMACFLASRVVSQLGPRIQGDIHEALKSHGSASTTSADRAEGAAHQA